MSLPTLKRLYRVSRSLKQPDIPPDGTASRPTQVTGIASFICLVIELDLQIFSAPFNAYVYPSRAGDGGTFSVSQFALQFDDLGFNEEDAYADGHLMRGRQLSKGDKIATKHIWTGSNKHPTAILNDADVLRPLVQELRVLAHAPLRDHDNIIDILGVAWEPRVDFYGRCWPVIVLEYAHCGNLNAFFTLSDINFDWSLKLKLAADIVDGLSALHECGVTHGDLKSENILVFVDSDGKFTAKLSDFGFAIIDADYPDSLVVNILGFTPEWVAPEARAGTVQSKRASLMDLYSFGLVFAVIMLSGASPFLIEGRSLTLKEIDKLRDNNEVGMAVMSNIQLQGYSKAQLTIVSSILESTLVSNPDDRCQDFGSIKPYVVTNEMLESPFSSPTESQTEIPLSDMSTTSSHESSSTGPKSEAIFMLPLIFHTATEFAKGILDTSHDTFDILLLPIAVHKELQRDLGRKAERLLMARDPKDQLEWQREAADAAYALSVLSSQGLCGIHDWDAAIRLLIDAAKGGCPRAKVDLPRLFAAMKRDIPLETKVHICEWLEEAIRFGEDRFALDSLERIDPNKFSKVIDWKNSIQSLGSYMSGESLWGERWDEAIGNAWEDYALHSLEIRSNLDDIKDVDWGLIEQQAMDDIPSLSAFICGSPSGSTGTRATKDYGGKLTWLHFAASLDVLELVELTIDQLRIDIDMQDSGGRTALFYATLSGNSVMANFLLDRGARASVAHDHLGNTCLHFVTSFDRDSITGIVRRLVENGGDINAQNLKQETPLHTALKYPISAASSFIAVQALLDLHADPWIPDVDGDMPHLWPVTHQQPECLRLLLSSANQSLSANELSILKATLFLCITEQPQFDRMTFAADSYPQSLNEIIDLLLDEQSVEAFKDLPDNGGDSVFFAASGRQGIDLAQAIHCRLDFVDINEKNTENKRPTIWYAVRHSQTSILEMIISLGADIFYKDSFEENIFHVAAEYSPQTLPLLLEIANEENRLMEMIEATTIDGATPLDKAIMSGNLEAADMFIARGADFKQARLRNGDGALANILGTVLTLPSTSVEQVSFVLKLDVPPIVSKDGSTVFHFISQVSNGLWNEDPSSFELDSKLRIFEILLQKYPDAIHVVNSNGETALHRASWGVRSDIVERLCFLGLDPNVKDRNGNTALDHLFRRKSSGLLATNYLLIKKAFELEVDMVEVVLRRNRGQSSMELDPAS